MVENFKSGIDNIRQDSPEWVTQKISTELASLSTEVETDGQKKDMFYKINGNEVEYHMEIVKKYLDSIKNLERNALKDKGAAWIEVFKKLLVFLKRNAMDCHEKIL